MLFSLIAYKCLLSALIAVPRTIITFIFGHPLDLLKTVLQGQCDKNIWYAIHRIYSKWGIAGFYKAGMANYMRSVLKEIYRAPLRGGLMYMYSAIFRGTLLAVVCTSFSMAFFDTMINCPIDRIKVWLMMNPEKNIKQYIEQSSENGALLMIHDLFGCSDVYAMRSGLSWISYLLSESIIRGVFTNYVTNLSLLDNSIIGFLSGIINGLLIMPFDVIKTNIQKKCNTRAISMFAMIRALREIVSSRSGIMGLYAGFIPRLLHYSIVGMVTGNIIPKIDQIWRS